MGTESWIEGMPAAITVTDSSGTIIAMNARSRETFAGDGGGALIGRSIFDCHPEPSRTKLQELYERRETNSYTIEKNGKKKIIHQIPWFEEGVFGGLIEISIPIPESLPHFKRD
jgi:PAS domain S-box-containing protein